jgi:hypothetical protein
MGEHQILAAKLKREIDGVGPSLTQVSHFSHQFSGFRTIPFSRTRAQPMNMAAMKPTDRNATARAGNGRHSSLVWPEHDISLGI